MKTAIIKLSLGAFGALWAAGAWAADTVLARIDSPGKVLDVALLLAGDGRLSYQVQRKGKQLIAPSRLGFVLANGAPLDGGFKLLKQASREHDDTWEQPWGERRYVRNHYKELRAELEQKGRRLAVVFRVFDDGIGFRYEFPGKGETRISDELTEFHIAPRATAWWQQAGEVWALEYPTVRTALAEMGTANTPLTIRTEDGTHIAFHEAALVDYASMWLRKVEGQKLRAQLAPSTIGPAVVRKGPFSTPWRTMQIADSAPGLYMSDLVLNLNEPNKLGDVSWVKPSKFIGVWWEMHLGHTTWGKGDKHGATTANTRRHIDFAAKHGFRGVLVEGWNTGWDADWVGGRDVFSFTQAYPDFDLPGLAAYARSKGVRLIGHHETGGDVANYERQMDAGYRLYAKLGVDSIKSGYVADGGAIRFPGPGKEGHQGYSDSQEGVRHFQKAVTEAARYKIAIDTHEPVKDTGLRRTYPNWVSREGARGMEYNAWGNPINPVDHEVNLVFTRMLSGPMDYTPGIVSLEGAGGRKINSTMAKQLASFVVIYSPIVMAADLIDNYEKHPGPFKFIKDVPTDWSDTRVLNGELGEYATIARKDRQSDNWYVGAVTDGSARTLPLPLSFLDPGKTYVAEIYRDGEQADYRTERRADIVIESRRVTASDTLQLRLAPGGGYAVRLVPEGVK